MKIETIYYSKKKTLTNIILMFIGVLAGIFLIINNSIFIGFIIVVGALTILLRDYRSKYKNEEPIIEFSNKGIQTEGEFIVWDNIKNISLKTNEDDENPYLQLIIEYTDKESMKDYQIEQKEIENDNYCFNKEEFDNSQRLRRKMDAALGIKNTYFEYFETEEDGDKTFNESSKNIIKPEAEIYYSYKTIDFEYADKNENEIKQIVNTFEKKANRKLP